VKGAAAIKAKEWTDELDAKAELAKRLGRRDCGGRRSAAGGRQTNWRGSAPTTTRRSRSGSAGR
jgi:hypothetical protein